MPETIRRVNGYDKNAYTYYPVLIVGAGESGIALGCRLKEKLGFDQFRIFDRQSGIGGTWWINRYPGIACDVPAVYYSFSFAPNPKWTTFFPPGSEIVKYLQGVCEQYRIVDKIQCNTDIAYCQWLEDEQLWKVQLRYLVPGTGDLSAVDKQKLIEEKGERAVYIGTEEVRAKFLVTAVGGLVEPRGWPTDIPGYDTFKGPIFHSARWDFDVDFQDKNVVVVGTGCSAAQLVPKLTKEPFNAKSVTQLMRSPPWVAPRQLPPGGDEFWKKWSSTIFTYVPGSLKLLRFLVFLGGERDWQLFGDSENDKRFREETEARLLSHMKNVTPSKYHDMLTPNYSVGCKRRIFDATWLPGLQDPKITLDTLPLTSLQEESVTLGPGPVYSGNGFKNSDEQKTIPADIVVLANGFDATKWLHPLTVIGKNGKEVTEVMNERGGPQAYQSAAMDGFPNFFMINGPNCYTGHNSVILATENAVNYMLPFMKLVLNGDATTVDVKKEAEVEYTKQVQATLKNLVFSKGGCHNWYVEDGWNGTTYPWSQYYSIWRSTFPRWGDWEINYTSSGFIKLFLKRIIRMVALLMMFVWGYKSNIHGKSFNTVQLKLLRLAAASRRVISRK